MRARRIITVAGAVALGAIACGESVVEPGPSGAPMAAVEVKEARTDNAAPVVERVTLLPEVLLPGHALEARVETSDPDGDPVRLEFEWRVNGGTISRGSSPVHAPQNLQKGDEVEVVVTAHDGRDPSAAMIAGRRVGNRPPVIRSVAVAPEVVRPGDEMSATPEGFDPDADELEFEYMWLVNGREADERTPTFTTRGLKRNDQVQVRVQAWDGEEESAEVTTAAIVVANSPPEFLPLRGLALRDGVFEHTLEAQDRDGDRSLRFQLLQGPRGLSVDPVLGVVRWQPTAEDAGTHVVEVAVKDGHGDGSALSFDLTVSATVSEPAPPAARQR
jgi:hypothetical protein